MRRYARPQNLSFKTQMHLTVKTACGYIARVVPSRRQFLVICCCWFTGVLVPAFGAPADEPFDAYLRRAANPDNLGLREDGRFYPYASPVGRRIGYRQEVADKNLYRDGWSREEAQASFSRQIEQVESEWRQKLPANYGKNFDELPAESRELLVDFGLSEGVDKVKPDFIKAALDLDWKSLLDPNIYVRYEVVWPHTERNKPFYDRWSGKVVGE